MDATNGKKILKVISDLEDEISSFGDAVAGMINANKDDCFLKAQTSSELPEERRNIDEAAHLVNQIDLGKNPLCLNEEIQSLTTNLAALKSELDGLKDQLTKGNELVPSPPPPTSVQTNFAEQVGRLVNYLERKFEQINSNQQLILAANQARLDAINERAAWASTETNLKAPRRTASNLFSNEVTEQSDENSIKELGNYYARFLNELRDDCVNRIKDAVALESEKIIGRGDDLSLKKLFDVIIYIIKKEKARFQNTLRDINERIFLALDDRVKQEQTEQDEQGESVEIVKPSPSPTPVADQSSFERKSDRKELLQQMNEIQEQLNNNLIKQYQFYGLKKN